MSFDFDIQALDLGRLGNAVLDILTGEKPKQFFDTATMTIEVVEAIDFNQHLATRIHGGMSVRWPGLIKPTSKKPVLGDWMMKDDEVPLFNVSRPLT